MRGLWRTTKTTLVVIITLWLGAGQALAQAVTPEEDYRVGVGDRLQLSVPQRPDLNRSVVVQTGGVINLPLVGDINVAGLTAREIEVRLVQSLREVYPSVTRVQVKIEAAMSQAIYVMGQVTAPGKYTFGTAPHLWEAIREAGGVLSTGDLSDVRVVKDRSKGGASQTVDVLSALENGRIEDLPTLESGDTVIIPEKSVGSTYTGSQGVYVFGAVLSPGVYRLEPRRDLMTALLQAGGPTERAELKKITIIRQRSDGNAETVVVNLENYLKSGVPVSNPLLNAGDTVSIPQQNWLSYQFKNNIGTILNVVISGISIIILVNQLQS